MSNRGQENFVLLHPETEKPITSLAYLEAQSPQFDRPNVEPLDLRAPKTGVGWSVIVESFDGWTEDATAASTARSTAPGSPSSEAGPKRPPASPASPPKPRPDAKPDEPTDDTSPTESSASCGETKQPDDSPSRSSLDKPPPVLRRLWGALGFV